MDHSFRNPRFSPGQEQPGKKDETFNGGSGSDDSNHQPPALQIGSYIADGKYKILRLIGRGAVGEVYQVEQVFLGQQLALKILSNVDVSDTTLRRFQLEAKAVNMLEHRNLVRGIDFGLIDGSQPFLVMDYVEGQNLSALLKSEGSLPISSVIEIFVSLCEAMDYAHANGVIHRDLKPSNIVLVQSSAGKMIPKIVDFGIAKVEMANARTLTRTGEVFGTPIYMSPEQCSGAKVDRRSDIYSLGCILFEALTGAPPFCGDTAVSTMMMHGNKAPSTLKEASPGLNIPEGLEEVVAKMLEKAPSNRYANCGDIANDLRLIGSGQFGKAEKEAVANDLATRQSKRILFFVAVLAPVALVAVAIVCVIWLGQMAPPKASDTKHSEIATVTSTSTLTDELDKNEAGQRKTSQSPPQAPSPLKKDSHSLPPVAEKTVNEEEDQIFKRDVEKLKELHEIGRDPGSIFQVGDDCLSVSDGALADLKKLPWLTELHLSECENITESGIVDVLKGLKHVRFLALDHTNVDGERLLPYLQSEYSRRGHPLYFLHLSHDRITDRALLSLKPKIHLANLFLAGNEFSDHGLEGVGRIIFLESLDLADCKKIDDDGIAKLAKSEYLSTLILRGTRISDNVVPTLMKMNIASLDLSETEISNAALKSLSRLKSLKHLYITNCNAITADGVAKFRQASKCEITTTILESPGTKRLSD